MDIDVMNRKLAELLVFKDRAMPLLLEWEAHKAKERIGAEPLPPSEQDIARSASRVLYHARNIERLVASKPK
jgi:hypothetical protein